MAAMLTSDPPEFECEPSHYSLVNLGDVLRFSVVFLHLQNEGNNNDLSLFCLGTNNIINVKCLVFTGLFFFFNEEEFFHFRYFSEL